MGRWRIDSSQWRLNGSNKGPDENLAGLRRAKA